MFAKLRKRLRRRLWPERVQSERLVKALRKNRISCVVDVGANKGQTGLELRHAGYAGRIISFEPSAQAYLELSRVAARFSDWIVAPRLALGEAAGEAKMNVSVTSDWNSLKAIRTEITGLKPKSRIVGEEAVTVERLDAVLPPLLGEHPRLFVKIDTQGFEAEVLAGASGLLDHIHGFKIELSLVALYEGEALYDHYINWMSERGFRLWLVNEVSHSDDLGRQLQVDAVFFRDD